MRLYQLKSPARIVVAMAYAVFLCLCPRGSPASEKMRHAVSGVDVTIAMGQVGDADLKRGIYIYHLTCAGSCVLHRIALNECETTNGDKSSFTPIAQSWSGPMLRATQVGSRIELTVYQANGPSVPAHMTWTFDGDQLKTLRDIKTSGFLDPSQLPQKMVLIEFDPIPRDRLKAFDCSVSLPGLAR